MKKESEALIMYDGECPFCLRMVHGMRPIWEGRGFTFVPLQEERDRLLGLLPEGENLMESMRVLGADGLLRSGADAHLYLWGKVCWLWPLRLTAKLPGGRWLINFVYRWVSANRYRISRWIGLDCEKTCGLPLGKGDPQL